MDQQMEIHAYCVMDARVTRILARASEVSSLPLSLAMVGVYAVLAYLVTDFRLPFILIIGLAILLGMALLNHWLLPKRVAEAMKRQQGIRQEFTFTDSAVTVRTVNDGEQGELTLPYASLPKVLETKCFLLLYKDRQQVITVDSTTMTREELETLRRRLAAVLGRRFRVSQLL